MDDLLQQAINEANDKRIKAGNELMKEALKVHGYEFETDQDVIKFMSESVLCGYDNRNPFGTVKSFYIKQGDKLNLFFVSKESIGNGWVNSDFKIMRP